jgi:tetratricopeptide (TPR) repeat protein
MGLRSWFQQSPRRTTEELLAEARAMTAASRFDEAIALYSKIPTRERTPAILIETARAHLASGNDQRALSDASDARDVAERNGSARDIAAAMCIQGEVLLHERRPHEAQVRFREALAFDPQCESARKTLEAEFPAPARPIDREVRAGSETSPRLNPLLGDEALARMRLDELNAEVTRLQGKGQHHEAIARAEEAMQFARLHLRSDHPAYAASRDRLAALHEEIGDPASAGSLPQQASELRRAALGEDPLDS